MHNFDLQWISNIFEIFCEFLWRLKNTFSFDKLSEQKHYSVFQLSFHKLHMFGCRLSCFQQKLNKKNIYVSFLVLLYPLIKLWTEPFQTIIILTISFVLLKRTFREFFRSQGESSRSNSWTPTSRVLYLRYDLLLYNFSDLIWLFHML